MSTVSSLTPRQQFWAEHLRQCAERGQSSVAYAAEHGLKVGVYERSPACAGAVRGAQRLPIADQRARRTRRKRLAARNPYPSNCLPSPISATTALGLYWERNGFVLWQKHLERDRFHWPRDDS